VQASRDDYIFLIENDCLVLPGCLDRMLAACGEFPADVAVPLLLEGPAWFPIVHHDARLGRIETGRTPDGRVSIRFAPSGLGNLQRRLQRKRCVMELFENHCLLLRRSVFDRIAPLDERLNTDEYIDLALGLRQAGLKTVFEPGARVHFHSPPPVNSDEEEFYRFRWDVQVAVNGSHAIRNKWNIENMSRTDLFAWSQQFRTSRGRWIAHRISLLFGAYRRVKLPDPEAPVK
jgi:GT2 family glycosyltransferase